MLTRHAHAPATDARLTSLLDAAAAPAEPGPVSGEEAALAAFRAASVRTPGWTSRMNLPTISLKTLGVGAAGVGLLLTGGVGAAYAGVLPGAAQDTARTMLGSVNVEVPGADEHSEGHADSRGGSGGVTPEGEATDAAPESLPDAATEFGQRVSELARATESGPGKGDQVSDFARTHGKAGEHRPDQAPGQAAGTGGAAGDDATTAEGEGGRSAGHARVEAPNSGGTATADGATAGAGNSDGTSPSSRGTGTAGEMSDNRSTDGSGNRP